MHPERAGWRGSPLHHGLIGKCFCVPTLYRVPVRRQDITLGQPLPWPLYLADGKLAMRQGLSIDNERQCAELLAKQIFRYTEEPPLKAEDDDAPNPFDTIKELAFRTEKLLTAINQTARGGRPGSLSGALAGLAARVREVCERDADAALAAVHWLRDVQYPYNLANQTRNVEDLIRRSAVSDAIAWATQMAEIVEEAPTFW